MNPKNLIFTKLNLISGSQKANILFPYMDDFWCNYGLDIAIVEATDIVSKNINASIDDMDIDNVLLQNFLYKPTISTDCLNLEEFKND